jgi:hypothetical protein
LPDLRLVPGLDMLEGARIAVKIFKRSERTDARENDSPACAQVKYPNALMRHAGGTTDLD